MLSLLRIRVKYVIRNRCLLFWTYLFLPIIIFILGVSFLAYKNPLTPNKYQSVALLKNKTFFVENECYSSIKENLPETAFLVPDKANCAAIQNVLKDHNLCNSTVCSQCSDKESDFDNKTSNIIKIEKEDKKYKVELKMEKYYNDFFPNIYFYNNDLDTDIAADPYYISELYINDTKEIPTNVHQYFDLQSLISRIIIRLEGKEIGKHNLEMYFGYNKYPDSYEFSNTRILLGIPLMIMFIFDLQFSLVNYNINISMISEKEAKLDIFLERQGISHFKYMLSWFFTYMALFLTTIVSFSVFAIQQSNGHAYLYIINLICFSISLYSVCAFFSVCFSSVKNGSTAIKFYNFGSIFLAIGIVLPIAQRYTKFLFAFIPQINFFMNFFSTLCFGKFDNISGDLVLLKDARISYVETIIMYLVEIIFYLLMNSIIYSYKHSGLPFYLYLKSFFTKVSRNVNANLIEEEKINVEIFNKYFQDLSEINRKKSEANQGLKLINVSKSFGDLKAVNCFNGELFSDEIFCLLGHNGAGKTTTINMISGIYDPDEGDILLDGRSIVTDKKYLYENIGLCQQENIFFDYLTVEEHLEYMCKINGSQLNQQEINELITKIDLDQKREVLCKTLSGGQKRKLCIALALIGNSKIILLDEPTSGMDIMSRRQLWEFLKNYKKEKIILLTTHFLDEAENLGDRIGIMLDGQYMCCGSSSFLKSKYPCGFNINLLINSKKFEDNQKNQFYNEIKKYEENAEIKVNSNSIFSINIPSENNNIKEIFDYIENCKEEFGIEDYTVGSTSLEDVFLKLNNKSNMDKINISDNNSPILKEVLPDTSSFCTQFCAHIRRNLYPFYRNKLSFFFELLAGLGFVYIFIFFFSDVIMNSMDKTLDLLELLKLNTIYVHTKNTEKNFFENSDVCNRFGSYMSFSELNIETDDFDEFRASAYENSVLHIAKGAINVIKEKNNGNNIYKVFNSETYTQRYGYLFANTMLTVSSFLKESFGIDATILNKISKKVSKTNMENPMDLFSDSIVLIVVCFLNFFGLIIFAGGLMYEKIKEKRTNIRHLLYLSGNNTVSYWLGFYVTDYIKLIVFTILLVAPIYVINGCATYFGLEMLVVNIGVLSFIYFITFFSSKEGDGQKILFSFIFSYLILLIIIVSILASSENTENLISFLKPYIPTIFDITPFTSMIFSFIRMIISYSMFDQAEKKGAINIDEIYGFYRPEIYLVSGYIAQAMSIIIYTLLLILCETGIFGKLIHHIHQSYADPDIKMVPVLQEQENIYNNNQNNRNDIIDNKFSINNDKNAPLIQPIPIYNNDINTNTNQNLINTNITTNPQYQYPNPNYQMSIQNQFPNPNLINIAPQENLDINLRGENLSKNPLFNSYVQSEIKKVNTQENLSTRIINVTKTFYPCCFCCERCRKNKVRAVNHLHLGLEDNEKFGLLGFNGSGKTTTFRIITNEIEADYGSINIFGYDNKTQFNSLKKMIGYCPQINPLFDFMKVREIIQFYSKLKTYNKSPEEVCEKFGLTKYLDTFIVNLSGGNKRKLTFAIALMNKPTLLLLDEPSTGVDPESRRFMWRNINELSDSGHKYNMILTTHSMEEAEILCDTVSWFREGNFITLGNPEQLKLKYSVGYKLHIKFVESDIKSQIGEENLEQLFNIICTLVSGFNNYSNFIIQNQFIEPYLRALINVVQKIKDKTKKISLYIICKDYSFDLVIQIIEEKKKELFTDILNMKNEDKSIEEMSISMQSLENILTSL